MPIYPYSNCPFDKYRQFFEFERKDYHFSVDIETGNLLFDKKLLTLNGVHLPIDLHLKYFQDYFTMSNNLNSYTRFPKGFKLNYHVYIFTGYNGYKYIDKDGFVHTFDNAINSMDLFFDSNGTGLMMIRTDNSGYKIFDDNDNYQLFDSSGRLIKIHKQVSLSKSYEINISYSSDLIISAITDSYNHSITLDYSTSNQIKIKYNNQIAFVLYTNNSYELVEIERYPTSTNPDNEELSWNSNGVSSLELATGEVFDFTYSNSRINSFNANYKQNYYSFSYYANDKKTIVHNARNVDTVYQYGQKQLTSQVSDDSTDLGYLTLDKDASSYVIKEYVTDCLLFNLEPSGSTPDYDNKEVSDSADYMTASMPSNLSSKRHYVLHAQINGNLGTGSLIVEMFDSSNRILAKLLFEGKTTVLVAPVGLYDYSSTSTFLYLHIKNNSTSTITINRVRLIPLLGDFSVLCSNVDTKESVFNYGTDSFYFLTKGTSLSFKNGNVSVVVPGQNFVTESDYIANEKLFHKRSGNAFNFWCNDKTELIANITEASIGVDASSSIIYNVSNDNIVLQTLNVPTTIKFYKISGSEDLSFIINEFTHNIISSDLPTGTFRMEVETRYICGHQTIDYRYYDRFDRLLFSQRNEEESEGNEVIVVKTIENSHDLDGNLSSETFSASNQTHQIVKSYTYDTYANLSTEQSLVGTSLQTTSYYFDSDNNLSLTHNSNSLDVAYTYEGIAKEKVSSVTYYRYASNQISQIVNYENNETNEMSVLLNSYFFTYSKGDVSGISNNNQGIIGFTYYPQVYNGHTLFDSYYTYYSNGYAFIKEYDQMGRLINDDKLLYEYDNFSNVSRIQDTTISSLDNDYIDFAYNYYDKLESIYYENSHLTLVNSYDEYGRVYNVSYEQYSDIFYSIMYSFYDCSGLEKSIKTSSISCTLDNIEINDEVDDYNRLETRDISINNAHGLLVSYSYCHNSTQTNNMISEVTYLETVSGAPTGSYEKDTYSYDSIGNITSIVRSFSHSQSTFIFNYIYDDFGRLVRENNQPLNRSYSYTYDKNGNITNKYEYLFSMGSLSNPISSRTYNYDLYCKDRLVSYGAEVCTYDNYGNPIMYRDAYLSWTRGTLLQSYTKGLKEIQFDYDGFKNRRGKTIYHDNVLVSEITYDYIDGKLLRENRPNNNSILFLYSHTGVVGFVYQSNVYFYEKNIQQDVMGIRNGNNQVLVRYVYDAWGYHKVFDSSGLENTNPSFIGNINPIRYRSYYYDTDLKMYWLTSRYYDPEIGRFISPDDWLYLKYKDIHGLNLYAYSKNNPVMYYDPSGHFWIAMLFAVSLVALIVACSVAEGAIEYAIWNANEWIDYGEDEGTVSVKNSALIQNPIASFAFSVFITNTDEYKKYHKNGSKRNAFNYWIEWQLHNFAVRKTAPIVAATSILSNGNHVFSIVYSIFDRGFNVDMEESKWWMFKPFGSVGEKVIEFLEKLFK